MEQKNSQGKEEIVSEEEILKKPHILTEFQKYIVDFQLENPKTKTYNQTFLIKYKKGDIDVDKLVQAFNKVINHFRLFQTTYIRAENGEIMQKYTPGITKEIKCEKMTEEEFQKQLPNMQKLFTLINDSLVNYRIIETESYVYTLEDFHHSINDGLGSRIVYHALENFYQGKPVKPDKYYYLIDKFEKYYYSPLYKEMENYYVEKYKNYDAAFFPKYDKLDLSNKDLVEKKYQIKGLNKILKELFKNKPYLFNTFFVMAGVLQIAKSTGKRDIIYSWHYHGRDSEDAKQSLGCYLRVYPVRVILEDKIKIPELCDNISKQSRDLLHKPFFAFTLKYMKNICSILYQYRMTDEPKFCGIDRKCMYIEGNDEDEKSEVEYFDIYYYPNEDDFDVELLICPFKFTEEGFENYKKEITDICFKLANNWNSSEYFDIASL